MLIKEFIAKQERIKKELIYSFKIGDRLCAIYDTIITLKWGNIMDIRKGEKCIVIDINHNAYDFPLRVKFYIDNEEIVTDLSFEELEDFERVFK